MYSTLCIKVETDHLCERDVQVCIYLKLRLIKSNPAVFLLIAKGQLVCKFKSLVEEILVSYLFTIISSLKGYSCLKYIRCFARLGITCTILKKVKNIHGGMSLLVKLQTYFTTSNNTPQVFFTFLKLYKWYEIAQRIL